MGNRMMRIVLLCFAAAHSQDVALLDHRLDSPGGQVWWVSVKNSEWIAKWEIEWWELCYFVSLKRIRKILRFLIIDSTKNEFKCGECLWELLRDRLSKVMICMIMMECSLIKKNEKGSQVMCGKTVLDNTEGWYRWRWCWMHPFSVVQYIWISWNHY